MRFRGLAPQAGRSLEGRANPHVRGKMRCDTGRFKRLDLL